MRTLATLTSLRVRFVAVLREPCCCARGGEAEDSMRSRTMSKRIAARRPAGRGPVSARTALGALPEWNLADLYSGLDDPAVRRDLDRADAECVEPAKLSFLVLVDQILPTADTVTVPSIVWSAAIQGVQCKQDLSGLAPKRCFVPAEAIEGVVGQIG